MKHWKFLLLCSMLGSASFNALACYTVYDRSNRVVYTAQTAPVDMSQPIHQTLPQVYPGGHMVFGTDTQCPTINTQANTTTLGRMGTPLLTDRRTAQSMRAPYASLPGNIAVVDERNVNMRPGVTVVPAVTLASSKPSGGVVITEMRNPPMTVVQTGNNTAVMGAGPRY